MDHPLANDLDHVLAHTNGVWDHLRGARLFITGGTGFFGIWLLESLAWAIQKLQLDTTATILTRDPERFRQKAPHLTGNPAFTFVTGDVTSFAFPAGRFTHVIHAATEASAALNDQDPLRMSDTIVSGTRRTLEFARQSGAKRFLLTSSGAVYGRQPPGMTHIPEEYTGGPDTTDPRSAYGESKRMAEWLCAAYGKQFGLECVIARCFAFVGPHLPLDIHFAAGNFIRDAIRGEPIIVRGDGTAQRSYLHSADLAVWLWTLLVRGTPDRAYNVGSDESISIRELASLVAGLVPGATFQVQHSPKAGTVGDRYIPAIRRIQTELQVDRNVSLADALRRTIRFATGTQAV